MLDALPGGRERPAHMSSNAARIFIASATHHAQIRIVGRAAVDRSRDFDQAVRCLAGEGVRDLHLDLKDCLLMDSTFIGALATLAEQGEGGNPFVRFTLVNASSRILDGLANLEVLARFTVAQGPSPMPTAANSEFELPAQSADKRASLEFCLKAHRKLMELSPANQERFKDVERVLAAELDSNPPR